MIRSFSAMDVAARLGEPACVVTIGNFDGVHLGHRELLSRTVALAEKRGLPAVAITFDPHPAEVLTENPPRFLFDTERRLEEMEELGIDAVVVLPFCRAMAAESAEVFCRRVFAEQLHAAELVIGYDFRLGCDRAGADRIASLGGWNLTTIAPVMVGGQPVSSTRIRSVLAEGRLHDAAAMLGRPFSVRGEIVHGAGRGGPMLGFPTANLDIATRQAMVAPSVYATAARLVDRSSGRVVYGEWMRGMTSFCKNPTFGGSTLTLETNILDFEGDIYGRELEVCFLAELRKDRRFDGLEALKAQLCADRESRRALPLLGE